MATVSITQYKVGDVVKIPRSPYFGKHKITWVSEKSRMLTATTQFGPVTASFDQVLMVGSNGYGCQ